MIAVMVRIRAMPLPRYLVLHPEARLTDAQVAQLYQWSRTERKRLRSMTAQSHTPSSTRSQ